MSSVMINSSIFDSKPLDKRNQKQKIELQLKQKLEKSIEQCLSEYMLTSFKKQISHDFQNKEQMSNKKGSANLSRASVEMKHITLDLKSDKKSVHNEVIHKVKSNIESFASSVLRIFEIQPEKKKIHLNHETQIKFISQELNQSNKNFLVELFTQLGLLKSYFEMDRSFIKLVNEAQKSYFKMKKQIQNVSSQMLQKLSLGCIQQQYYEIMKQKETDIEALSTFYSAKKRIFDTFQRQEYEMKKTLESGQSVIGYSSKPSERNFDEEETKETSNFPINFKERSSLPSEFYFIDFSGGNSQQKEDQAFEERHQNLFTKVYKRYQKYDKFGKS